MKIIMLGYTNLAVWQIIVNLYDNYAKIKHIDLTEKQLKWKYHDAIVLIQCLFIRIENAVEYVSVI